MQIEKRGNILVLTIDIGEAALAAAPASSSGKTRLAASTGGFRRVGPVSISLNVAAPNPAYEYKAAQLAQASSHA